LWAHTYYAATTIHFVAGAGQRRRVSPNTYPMRLDTAAFVSAIPQRWVPLLAGFLHLSSQTLSFGTAGGPGAGRIAPGAAILFPDDPCRDSGLDFLVTPGLDQRNYGLLSLREVVRYFTIESRGSHQIDPDGKPIVLPTIELIPR
jgi:hypothetical protein